MKSHCWNFSRIDQLFLIGQIVSHLRTKPPLSCVSLLAEETALGLKLSMCNKC